MDWLSQNWLWVIVGVGIAYYLFRGRLGGHGLGGHGAGHGGLIGMGHGGNGGGGHAGHGEPAAAPPDAANAAEAAVDPVSGEAVRTAQAVTSIYQDRIYYFSSKENRDRFEAAPQDYAHKAAGRPLAPAQEYRPRRRRGC